MRLLAGCALAAIVAAGSPARSAGASPTVGSAVLPNGVTLVTRQRPGSQVVAIDVAIRAGARYEGPTTPSAARFLQSALLLGTETRPTRDALLRSIAGRGGQLSAAAGREIVEVSATISLPDLDHALAVIAEMVLRSRFDPNELERERQVILSQIREREDEPEDNATDVLLETVFAGHPLGNRPTGRALGVEALTVEQLRAYWDERRVGPNIVVGVVSGLSDEALLQRLGPALGAIPAGRVPRANFADLPESDARTVGVPGGTDQAHVYLGAPLPGVGTSDRAALQVLSAILGRTSGRLFTEIRDRRGLAYTTYTTVPQYADAGIFIIYAGTAPANADRVADLLKAELARIADAPVSLVELQDAIEGEIGGQLIASETSAAEVIRLTRDTIHGIPPREIQVAQIRAVTPADVQAVARRYLDAARLDAVITRPAADAPANDAEPEDEP